MIDALTPRIEEAVSEGAVVTLKWDGERTFKPRTVVVTRQDSNFVWRKDCVDIAATLTEAVNEYAAADTGDAKRLPGVSPSAPTLGITSQTMRFAYWAAAGFKDTLLRWKMKLEVADGHEKEIQSRVQA